MMYALQALKAIPILAKITELDPQGVRCLAASLPLGVHTRFAIALTVSDLIGFRSETVSTLLLLLYNDFDAIRFRDVATVQAPTGLSCWSVGLTIFSCVAHNTAPFIP